MHPMWMWRTTKVTHENHIIRNIYTNENSHNLSSSTRSCFGMCRHHCLEYIWALKKSFHALASSMGGRSRLRISCISLPEFLLGLTLSLSSFLSISNKLRDKNTQWFLTTGHVPRMSTNRNYLSKHPHFVLPLTLLSLHMPLLRIYMKSVDSTRGRKIAEWKKQVQKT